ncbi:MAG: barstar family protein [Acidobacteriota bacterium]
MKTSELKLGQVTWECVHFCEVTSISEISESMPDGFSVFKTDFGIATSKERLLAAVAEAMSFPDYFGMNWDALDESLGDLPKASGYVLIASGSEKLWQHNPRLAASFLESWCCAAEGWADAGVPFHLVFVW